MIEIRPAGPEDAEAIGRMLRQVAEEGDSFPFREGSAEQWMAAPRAFVACLDGRVVGTYLLRPNHSGRGAHVANAAYVVERQRRGEGIGTALVEHSLQQARDDGYLAMQFNLVVSTNRAAMRVYKKLGFEVVGTLPKAFEHRELGLVDAHVMYRRL
jgi:GNAT superfamily N-acetyltransferase